MLVLNKNEKPVSLPLDRFGNMLGKSITGTEIISGKKINLKEPLQMVEPGPSVIEIR
jgi:hypothetical protein